MDHASGVPDLSFHLLHEITDGFSPDRILGIGSFGKVYMGEQRNGKKIAVKVLHDMIALDEKQFINEYNNLTKLKHHNIVRLVGYCQENRKECVHYEGRLVLAEEIKRVLCFEYLHNGSLDKYLSDEHHGQDWNTRYVIIKGICNGLKYLHEDLEAPMYHLDLKPANILLDENMEPKIADFGLSRLFGEERTRITTSSIGTLGYLPPEYIDENIISNTWDIFSLGVIVIKIMTGRSGYKKCFEMPPQQFIQLVQENWRNRLQKPTDFEEVKRCIEIALRCLQIDRRSRPTIGEIVHQLSETETVSHNLFTKLPHWVRNDPAALDNTTNVPVSGDKQQGNDPGPSTQQAPPVQAIVNESKKGVPLPELWRGVLAPVSKLTASSSLEPGLEGAASSGSGANIRMHSFLNSLRIPIYIENITAQLNALVRIGIFGGDNLINAGPLPNVNFEMLVLRGEFSNDNREIWTEEELKRHIVQRLVLGDDGTVNEPMKNLIHDVQAALERYHQHQQSRASEQGNSDADEILRSLRKYLLLLGILAVTVTYQVGLNPPGGLWQNDASDGPHRYLAGDPILGITYPRRYRAFFYSNAIAFISSLVISVHLLINIFSTQRIKYWALQVAMILELFGLIGAYAAGSSRKLSEAVYISLLAIPVFLYIGIRVVVFMLGVFPAYAAWRQALREKLKQYAPGWLKEVLEHAEEQESATDVERTLEKSRKLLLLVAALAATGTYQVGMSPPGGFWQETMLGGHVAGDPVLNDNYPRRYRAFFYFNATAFVSSLAVIMLLVNRKLPTRGIGYHALRVCVILFLVGLLGAFAAGSCRKVSEAVYVSLLAIPVFLYVGIRVVVFMLGVFPAYAAWRQALREKLKQYTPGWLKEVLEHAEEQEAAADVERKLEKSRKHLLLLASLAAIITYQAGMSPPGGFWQENKPGGHVAGDPVLKDNYPRRYLAFFYCNSTAFVSSLAVIMLLVNRKLSTRGIRYHARRVCVILCFVGLLGAFAAVTTLINVLVLIFAVVLGMLYIARQVRLVLSDTVRGLKHAKTKLE